VDGFTLGLSAEGIDGLVSFLVFRYSVFNVRFADRFFRADNE
jgi:hypothetical protein